MFLVPVALGVLFCGLFSLWLADKFLMIGSSITGAIMFVLGIGMLTQQFFWNSKTYPNQPSWVKYIYDGGIPYFLMLCPTAVCPNNVPKERKLELIIFFFHKKNGKIPVQRRVFVINFFLNPYIKYMKFNL